MRSTCFLIGFAFLFGGAISSFSAGTQNKKHVLLVAGDTAKVDRMGHHDYLAGCRFLADLLEQIPRVRTTLIRDGWPHEEDAWSDADAVVFYTDGGGKQAYLRSAERRARVQSLADRGVGLVFIHQAIDYPVEFSVQAIGWQGGVYAPGRSGRGHWITDHRTFPEHPITRGVAAWEIVDGWLNKIAFVDGMVGITPLVWSGKVAKGSPSGGVDDIVGWAYDRPNGGRSFCFSGLDAHSAWSLPGMRLLVVQGILWTGGIEIPAQGVSLQTDEAAIATYLTPRTLPSGR